MRIYKKGEIKSVRGGGRERERERERKRGRVTKFFFSTSILVSDFLSSSFSAMPKQNLVGIVVI
jgi:hypothetical protein